MFKKLEIQALNKAFGNVQALKNVSVSLDAGNILAVLGPSGCGKTTLLRSNAGFTTPDSGTIAIDGQEVYGSNININPEHRKIGYVPQDGVLFPQLSVGRNIAFGLPKAQRNKERIHDMLDLVGMVGLEDRMPHELSGGQQQRIALARALAPAPSLVLMDEPFSALDAGLRASLREEVKHSLAQIGATAIIVTHDQEEALSIADLVAVMRNGKCIQIDDPVSLYKRPADMEVARFVGEATVLQAPVMGGTVHSPFGQLPLACPNLCDCQNAQVVVRPEQFVISEPNEYACGKVVRTVFYGHDAIVCLKMDEKLGMENIHVRVSGSQQFTPGDTVGLKVAGEVMAYAPTTTTA